MSETGPDHTRTFTWDALGHLTGIQHRGPAGESTTTLTVDAFGDLAALNNTPLAWDPTGLVPQLRRLGDTTILGDNEHTWASVNPHGVATWLDTDWQHTIGTGHDPWGATTTPDASQLGWRAGGTRHPPPPVIPTTTPTTTPSARLTPSAYAR